MRIRALVVFTSCLITICFDSSRADEIVNESVEVEEVILDVSINPYRIDVANEPVLDGKLTEKCWKEAQSAKDFWKKDGSARAEESARAKVCYDEENLYISFWVPLKDATALKSAKSQRPDEFLKNTVEVFLDPLQEHRRDAGLGDDPNELFHNHPGPKIFRFGVNSAGGQYSEIKGLAWWKVPWQSATYIGDNFWSVEIRIPFASLAFFEPGVKTMVEPGWGLEWGVNFVCNDISWVPEFDKSGYPLLFGHLSGIFISPNPHRWAFLIGIGPKIVGDVPLVFTLDNATGENRKVKVVAEIVPDYEQKELFLFKTHQTLEVKNEGWNHGSFKIPMKSPGPHIVLLSIVDEKSNKVFAYRPVLIENVEVAEAVWDRSFYMDETEANLTISSGLDLNGRTVHCDLRQKNKNDILQTKTTKFDNKGKATAKFDLMSLSISEYKVIIAVSGYEKFPFVKMLKKCEKRPGAVKYTDNGILLRDGKPFFPFGLYYVQNYLQGSFLEEYAMAGFNTFPVEWVTASGYIEKANKMKQYGIVPIVSIHNMVGMRDFEVRGDSSLKGLIEDRFPFARKAVKMISDQAGENILAWYTRDEPNELMYPLVRGLHDIVNEGDPYHPSMTVIFTPHLFPAYHDATDILAPDIYSRGAAVGNAMAKAVKDMRGKPVFAVLQTFYEGSGHMPSRAEIRNMTYLSIVNGVTGVLYFSYDFNGPMAEKNPEAWKALKELAGEIRDLTPVLLSPPPSDVSLKEVSESTVNAKLYSHGNSYYIIAVNSENNPVKKAKFSLKSEKPLDIQLKETEVLFENRNINMFNDTFEDDFSSYGVHIYKTR